MSKKLQNKTLTELKDLCRIQKIKGYSKLNKDEIIKLLKRKYKKGGSSDDPIINVYIYKVLGTERIDNLNIVNHLTKQKFSKFYPTKNGEHGVIYPNSYINNRTNPYIEKKFTSNMFVEHDINAGKYYSIDPLTSIQTGGENKNVKNYYDFYLSKLTKVKNFENSRIKFYNNENVRVVDIITTIIDANEILYGYIIHNSVIKNAERRRSLEDKIEGAYIFNVNINPNEKVIIFGDFHGSYHTFFRIFTRLHIQGIIDFNNFIINEGYRLVFLGDIADRGQYALEIYYILSKFIVKNNTNDYLKIIINRGNHEDPEQWIREEFSFLREVSIKIPDLNISELRNNENNENNNLEGKLIDIFIEKVIEFLSNCSSAIILNYNTKKYWLCHGGFPIGQREDYRFSVPIEVVHFYPNDVHKIPFQIRWCDFYNNLNTNHNGFDNNGRPQIGINKLKRFLFYNNINFIIRGHNDNFDNAFILSDSTEEFNESLPNFVLRLNFEDLSTLNPSFKKTDNNRLIYPDEIYDNLYVPNLKQTNGPVFSIRTNDWIKKEGYRILSNIKIKTDHDLEETIYPVLTISTNSDLNRSVNNDSFIVLNFSNDEDFSKINRSKIIDFFRIINSNFSETIDEVELENQYVIPAPVAGNNMSVVQASVHSNNNNLLSENNVSGTWKNVPNKK
jgi:hypothetical protein